jgi:hypothetical protein
LPEVNPPASDLETEGRIDGPVGKFNRTKVASR